MVTKSVLISALGLSTLILSLGLAAKADPVPVNASVTEVFGNAFVWHGNNDGDDQAVEAEKDDDTPGTPLKAGDVLVSGDHVETDENSGLELKLDDGSVITLGHNTDFTLAEMNKDGEDHNTLFTMLKGLLKATVNKLTPGSRFELSTDHGVAAVKGTEYEAEATDGDTTVRVDHGKVWLAQTPQEKPVEINEHQSARALKGGSLENARDLRPEELQKMRNYWAKEQLRRRALKVRHRLQAWRRRVQRREIRRVYRERGVQWRRAAFRKEIQEARQQERHEKWKKREERLKKRREMRRKSED